MRRCGFVCDSIYGQEARCIKNRGDKEYYCYYRGSEYAGKAYETVGENYSTKA